MDGPWLKYQNQAPADGPWTKYAAKPETEAPSARELAMQRAQMVAAGVKPEISPERIAEQAAIDQPFKDQMAVDSVGKGRAMARSFMNGVPFVGSYMDEINGALYGEKSAEQYRAAREAYARLNPKTDTALNVAGTVAGSIPLIAAAPVSLAGSGTLGAQALRGAAIAAPTAALEGAVYGGGQSEGGGRAANATQNAIFGGIGGGLVGAAAPYATKALGTVWASLKGSDEAVIAKTLGVSKPVARVIRNALESGDMAAAERVFYRAGDNAMLADAGQAARELLDASANAGGQAGSIVRRAVDDRASADASELSGVLDKYLGRQNAPIGTEVALYDPKIAAAGRDAERAADGWVIGGGVENFKSSVRSVTKAVRQRAYDAAYERPIDYSGGRGKLLEGLLKRVPKSAIDKANELMRVEGVESKQIIAKMLDDGTVSIERLPDVRQLDYITRGLNEVADLADGQGKLGGQTAMGRAYSGLAKNIRSTLKAEVPEYARALDVASDAISRVKASDIGYSLLRSGTTRESISEAMRGASKSEQDAMRRGVREYIDDTLANVARTITDPNTDIRETMKLLKDLSSRSNQTKLRYLLGKGPADSLLSELDKYAISLELRAAISQNTKTAIRQSIQGSVKDQAAPGTLELLSSGEAVQAGKRFVQIFTGNSAEAQALREQGIFQEIATALTQTRGKQAQAALRLVDNAMKGQRLTEQQAAWIGTILADSAVLPAGRASSSYLTTP